LEIVLSSLICVTSGCDFIKTSTGFGYGGASVRDVELMRLSVGDGCEIKASGGVGGMGAAMGVVGAGASRIGASKGVQIVRDGGEEWEGGGY